MRIETQEDLKKFYEVADENDAVKYLGEMPFPHMHWGHEWMLHTLDESLACNGKIRQDRPGTRYLYNLIKYAESLPQPQEEPTMKEVDWGGKLECDLGPVKVNTVEKRGWQIKVEDFTGKPPQFYFVDVNGKPLWPLGPAFQVRNNETALETVGKELFSYIYEREETEWSCEGLAAHLQSKGLLRRDSK